MRARASGVDDGEVDVASSPVNCRDEPMRSWPRRPRLHVHRHAVAAAGRVGALDVAELDELVADQPGVAVGDHQVALARARPARPGASVVVAVPQARTTAPRRTRVPSVEVGAVRRRSARTPARTTRAPSRLRLGEEVSRRAGRIDDRIARHAQRAGQPGAEQRLGLGERARVEPLGGDAGGVEALRASPRPRPLSSSSAATHRVPVGACSTPGSPRNSFQSSSDSRHSASSCGSSSMTTRWPMAAPVAPPPTTRGSATTTREAGARRLEGDGAADDAAAGDEHVGGDASCRARCADARRNGSSGRTEQRRLAGDVGARR